MPSSEGRSNHWRGVGSWVEANRFRLGLTQAEAAERAGVSVSTWATLEAGGRNYRGEWIEPSPGHRTLARIAQALEVPLRQVYEVTGTAIPPHLEQVVAERADMGSHQVTGAMAEITPGTAALSGVDISDLDEADRQVVVDLIESLRKRREGR